MGDIKYCYEITGDTSFNSTATDDTEIITMLQKSGQYISNDPINWNEKRMPTFGVLEDIPKPEPPVIIIPEPTAEQLKMQREQKLENLYISKKTTLAVEYTAAVMTDDTLKAAEYGTNYKALEVDYDKYKDSIEHGNDPFATWGLGSFDSLSGAIS